MRYKGAQLCPFWSMYYNTASIARTIFRAPSCVLPKQLATSVKYSPLFNSTQQARQGCFSLRRKIKPQNGPQIACYSEFPSFFPIFPFCFFFVCYFFYFCSFFFCFCFTFDLLTTSVSHIVSNFHSRLHTSLLSQEKLSM